MTSTLFQMLGVNRQPTKLSESALVIVDAQREYVDGQLPLTGVKPAIEEIRKLLDRARKLGSPLYFIRHSAGQGAPVFNPDSEYFEIVPELTAQPDETIIDKNYPSSFAQTPLNDYLQKAGIKNLIVTGFMTHACISTTTRAGAELGYTVTVPSAACATRDLPSPDGGVLTASQLHVATLSALSDLFATIVQSSSDIKD